ncbi:MAG: hypothetical protein IKJ65_01940 [Clostridia bacterium]|nr:hypothetical protein [Clostridia bacterium]
MANIFELVGTIAIMNGDANKAIDETSSKAKAFATAMKKGITDAGKWAAGIATAATAATVAITNEIKKIVSSAAEHADTIDKMSQNMGLSTQAYQEWEHALNHCGLEMERLHGGMDPLRKLFQSANDGTKEAIEAFDDLGFSAYSLEGDLLNDEQALERVIYALADMEDIARRNEIADMAFGGAYEEMLPLLNLGSEGIKALREEAHALGLVMSGEDVAAGVEYTDTIYDLSKSFQSLKDDLGMMIIPKLTELAEKLLEKIPEIKEKLSEWEEPITNTVGKLVDGLEWVIDNPEKVGAALEGIGIFMGTLFAVTHPVEASIFAIGAGIVGLVNAFSGGNTETKNFEKTMSELDSTFLSTMQDIQDEYMEANTLLDVIEELGSKTKLTATESEKWRVAVERLDKLLPGFKESVDNETRSIKGGTGAIRERIQAIRDQAAEEAKATYLKDKQSAVAAAYAATGKLQLDIDTQRNIWANRDLEVLTSRERYDALQAKVDEYERQDRYAPYDLLNERDIAYSEWRDALRGRAEAGKEIERMTKDLENLIPAIEKAEEELAAAEKAIEGGAEGLADTLTAAAEVLNETEILPDLAENAENNLQSELNDMDLSVSVSPSLSGSGFFRSFASGDYYRSKVNEALNGLPGHANGLDNVPYDNYIARLHKGETVLTAKEASAYRNGEGSARVEEAVNRLYEIMKQVLAAIIAGQVIQLDTGALVGATAGAMNERLGVFTVNSGRRN